MQGWEVLIKVILTLLKYTEPRIRGKDFETVLHELKTFAAGTKIDTNDFFQMFDKQFDFSNYSEQSFYEKAEIRLSQKICLTQQTRPNSRNSMTFKHITQQTQSSVSSIGAEEPPSQIALSIAISNELIPAKSKPVQPQ